MFIWVVQPAPCACAHAYMWVELYRTHHAQPAARVQAVCRSRVGLWQAACFLWGPLCQLCKHTEHMDPCDWARAHTFKCCPSMCEPPTPYYVHSRWRQYLIPLHASALRLAAMCKQQNASNWHVAVRSYTVTMCVQVLDLVTDGGTPHSQRLQPATRYVALLQ